MTLLFGVDIALALSAGYVLRLVMKQVVQPSRYDFANEMISTFELSACIFELGVFDRVYGVAPTFFCAFCLLLAKNYNVIFQGRPANPCGVVEHAFGQSTPRRHLPVFWLFQLFGALAAYPYVSIIWTVNQSSQHLEHLRSGFQPELKVGIFSGFMIELFATFCCNFVDFATRTKPYETMNPWVKAVSCVGMAFLLAETTGVWMNPALATAHIFRLKDDFLAQHIFVYWLGPILGVALAFLCEAVIRDHVTNKKKVH